MITTDNIEIVRGLKVYVFLEIGELRSGVIKDTFSNYFTIRWDDFGETDFPHNVPFDIFALERNGVEYMLRNIRTELVYLKQLLQQFEARL